MKSLRKFIFEEKLKYNFDNYCKDNNVNLKELDIDECLVIQDDFLNSYNNYEDFQFWLYETLGTSLTYDKVIHKVEQSFKDRIQIYPVNVSSKIKTLHCIGNKEDIESNKFQSMLNLFNYEIIDKRINDDQIKCYLKPRKSTDKTDFIFGDCNRICYHLTSEPKYKKIKKEGIIPKSGGSSGINRIYVLSSPNLDKISSDVFSLLLSNIKNIKNGVKFVLLKIEIPENRSIKFFEDDGAKGYNAFWTMEYIPSSWIKEVTKAELPNTIKIL